MPNLPAAALPIPAQDLRVLRRWAQASSLPASLAQRAKILLSAAEGTSNTATAEQLGITRPTVIAWRQRYTREGLTGLADRPRPGHAQTVRRARHAEILATTLIPPPRSSASRIGPAGCSPLRWGSVTAPSPACGPSTTSGPGRPRRSNSPPIRPVRPVCPGRPERHTHDDLRHGTATLFAALEVATGHVTDAIAPRHRHTESLAFLQQVAKTYPRRRLHVICDNYATHKHQKVQAWLHGHPRVQLHFPPPTPRG